MTDRYDDCHRPLKRPEYRARGTGPKCGGPIRRGRRPAAVKRPAVPKRPVAEQDEQLELITVEEVSR